MPGLKLPRFRSDEPLYEWLRKLGVAVGEAWKERRRRLESACTRCGKPAAGACAACQALTCADCSVVSIETGSPTALCVGCSGRPRAAGFSRALRGDPWQDFRRGVSAIAFLVVVAGSVSFHRAGAAGLGRLAAFLVQPAVLFAFVPLAWLIGFAGGALRRLLRD